ncbi:porin family protein [Pedobacter sp. UYP1]|uniref:porin family protein n=1 Tax=Pedobacter sp. UYP1 TaxID=1756396 RepID=UPI003393AC45
MKIQFNKRSLFLIPMVSLALITTQAKSQSANPIHLGLKGGANFTDLSLNYGDLKNKYSAGYSAGAFTRVDIAKLYIQGELLYSHKSSKVESNTLGSEKTSWNSIDVPVTIGYKILKSDNLSLRVFGGGVYSYILNDKAHILQEVKESFKKFGKSNIGYVAGVGVDLGKITFDLSAQGSLTKMSSDFKSRPLTFQATVGFMIF